MKILLGNAEQDLQITLGAAILLNRVDIAQRVFAELTTEVKDLFIQFPTYHLWQVPLFRQIQIPCYSRHLLM